VEEDSRANAHAYGSRIDYGRAFYVEAVGKCKYRTCTPGGAICIYSENLDRAKFFLERMSNQDCHWLANN